MVIEFLSPGTDKEDLGPYAETEPATREVRRQTDVPAPLTIQASNGQAVEATPSGKWVVYEQILRVPYYLVFSCYTNTLRFFQLMGGHYQEQPVDPEQPRVWLPELNLGLGLWQGEFEGIARLWLRWYDAQGRWID